MKEQVIIEYSHEISIRFTDWRDKQAFTVWDRGTGYGFNLMSEAIKELLKRQPEAKIKGITTVLTECF